VDEEVVLLEEQLASAHADIEQLQARLAEAEARATGRDAEAADLRRELEALREDTASRGAAQALELETLGAALIESEAQAREAARRYREAALAHEPDLPADLVDGDTVAAIDEALARARQTVAQVRQHIEQQAQALRVPAGAPVRSAPDTSSLTPAEKIRHGLQQG
jgi:hypothetical protein